MSCLTSITPAVWLRNTRNNESTRTSIDDGWIAVSSKGSMPICPAAIALRRSTSDRITCAQATGGLRSDWRDRAMQRSEQSDSACRS